MFGGKTDEDKEMALKWLKRSAKQGDYDAQFWLGVCYFDGIGVDENSTLGIKWLSSAENKGHPYAKDALDNLLGNNELTNEETNTKDLEEGDMPSDE